MSCVKMSIRNDAMKKSALTKSDNFLPMSPGSGAKKIGPKSPPTGKKPPIHESWSAEGTKSNGELDRSSVIFAMAGLDQPIHVPHEIPIMFAETQTSFTISISTSQFPYQRQPPETD